MYTRCGIDSAFWGVADPWNQPVTGEPDKVANRTWLTGQAKTLTIMTFLSRLVKGWNRPRFCRWSILARVANRPVSHVRTDAGLAQIV